MRLKPVLLSLSAAAALGAPLADAVPLVTNGSFELTTNGGNRQLSSTPVQAADRSTLTGWTSSNGNDGGYNFVLDTGIITTSASAIGLKAYVSADDHGKVFASDALYYPGTLSQTIDGLTVGATYLLTFDYALGQQAGFDGRNADNYWQVGFGDAIQNSGMLTLEDGGFSGWKSASMRFTATSASQVLSFLAKGSSPGAPPFLLLDDVALDSALPEPSTLALMLGGAGLLALLARRRRPQA
jgi:PEP-CTERM motif